MKSYTMKPFASAICIMGVFVFIFFFQAGCSSDGSCPAPIDELAPVPGNLGVITTSNLSHFSMNLHWTAAVDGITVQSNLQYKVVYSLSNNVHHIFNAEVNGTVVLDWTTNVTSIFVTNLSGNTPYYFNVIVRDAAGNKAVYVALTKNTSPFIFAYTSFEECPVPDINYYKDFGKPLVSHMLTNNPDNQSAPTNNIVHWVKTGKEMGFASHYIACNGIGLTEGDVFGVNDDISTVIAYPDGSKGFQFGDMDGTVELRFDTVSLVNRNSPSVSLDLFIAPAGGYANSERLYVYFIGDTIISVPMTNFFAADLSANMGKWINVKATLSSYTSAQLIIMASNNQDDEIFYVDNVYFREY